MPKRSRALQYPIGKSRKDDFFRIIIKEYKPGKFSSDRFGSPTKQSSGGKIGSSIFLPMPWNIPVNATSADWAGSSINPLATALGSAGETAIGEGLVEGFNELLNQGDQALEELARSTSIGAIQTAFVNEAIKAATGSGLGFQQSLSRFAGVRFDQNVELTFSGMQLRNAHVFSFQLSPRSDDESLVIKEIIRTLKVNMTPKKNVDGSNSSVFIGAPNLFEISYMKGKKRHPYLNTFKTCALTGLSVNLSPDGYSTYWDGAPVSMNLSLSFQELTPIYQEDYENERRGRKGLGY
jgi:hypothetical protein